MGSMRVGPDGPQRSRPAGNEAIALTPALLLVVLAIGATAIDERTSLVVVRLAGWMGLCVDGSWVGWRRGAHVLRQLRPSGLHRLAVLEL